MKKNMVMISLFLAFSLILSACANAAPTQDPGQAATQVAAQVEAQVATRVAQAMDALAATQKAQTTSTPFIPTIGANPTLSAINTPTVSSLPGLPTGVACLATPRSEGESHPDGTTLYINTAFTKKWAISNQGSCTWNANYKLKFVSGDQMGGPAFILFGASVPPWQTITLSLPLTTTSSVGTSTGYWGLYDDKDVYFGRVWVTINRITVPPTSTAFAVNNVITTVSPTALCTSSFTFTFNVTADRAGDVQYELQYPSGTVINSKTLTFTSASTITSTLSWTPGAGFVTGSSIYVYIRTPNNQYFSPVILNCS